MSDPIADPELTTFSIREDIENILPVVREAMALIGPACEVILSPWSPPWQWKTAPELRENEASVYGSEGKHVDKTKPGCCFGGRLKKEYYGAWAKYITRYVQAYLDEGIPVTMLSVQNEPDAATSWDSCLWSAEEERIFLRDALYPALEAAGLADHIDLFIWDHNKERMVQRVQEVLQPDVLPLVKGVAYHWYTGDHFEALSMVRERFPHVTLLHSESCPMHIPYRSEAYYTDDMDEASIAADRQAAPDLAAMRQDYRDAADYAHDIIGDLNHGMNRWIDWNLIVDRSGGPRHVSGGFAAPLLAEQDGSYTKTLAYRWIRLIAKAIPADSIRLGVSCYTSDVDVAALRCPDGQISILMNNSTDVEVPMVLRYAGMVCHVPIEPRAVSVIAINE